MDLKKAWSKSNWMFVLKNFLVAGVLFVLITTIVLFAIDSYTNHGAIAIVPDLYGKYTEEASVILAKEHIKFQVIDSVYDRSKALSSIVEQTPPAGTTIKKNSTVYLIINTQTLRQITVPELRDMSLRQAEATLNSIGLKVGRITYTPSEYNNLVINVHVNERSLQKGTRLPEQSSVDLTVGIMNETIMPTLVPDLIGLTLEQARLKIIKSQMVVGEIKFDVPPTGNESEYFVYAQSIKSGKWENAGKAINISLGLGKNNMGESTETTQEEEDFF